MDEQPVSNQPASNQTTSLPSVPAEWPGGFGLYKYSRQAVARNWVPLLILLVVSSVSNGIAEKYKHESWGWIAMFVAIMVSIVISIVTTYLYLQSVKGNKLGLGGAIKNSLAGGHAVDYVIASVLVGIIAGVSLMLFIIPFLFIFPRLLLTTYFIIDKAMGPVEAIKASWAVTKGYSLKAWSIVGVNVAIALLIFTIIGIPFALYFYFMYSAAFALLYFFVTGHSTIPADSAPAATE